MLETVSSTTGGTTGAGTETGAGAIGAGAATGLGAFDEAGVEDD
jgi:hypothetical protein